MATVALAYSQPRPTFVSSFFQRGSAESWTNLVRVPYTALPEGTAGGYSIVAFGHCGRFSNFSAVLDDKFALVAARFDQVSVSHIADTLTRIPISAQIYQDGVTPLTRNRAHPWCAVVNVAAGTWPATTDLVISATVERLSTAASPPGSFWCDATTVLVFSHAGMVVVPNSNSTPATLPYSDVSELVLVDGTTIPSTGDWMCFYSAQVAPGPEPPTPGNTYWTWLGTMRDGSNIDGTFGIDGRAQTTGAICRYSPYGTPAPPADPLLEMYSMGGWWPITVSNGTTKMQMRGFSFYAAATTIERAEFQSGAMFLVPFSAFSEAVAEAVTVLPTGFNRNGWSSHQTMLVDAGDDRARFAAISMSSMYDGTTTGPVTIGANYLTLNGGFPPSKNSFDALNTAVAGNGTDHCPSYASHIVQAPWILRYGDNYVQHDGILSQHAGYTDDSGARFYSAFAFGLTNDGDRSPPTPAQIAYTAITLNKEIDIGSIPQMDDSLIPDEGMEITLETGLTSFQTEDGHVIRWPRWASARRAWRLSWACDQAKYLALYVYLQRPNDSQVIRLPAGFVEAPSAVVYVEPSTLRAEQTAGVLAWDVSVIVTELRYHS